MKTEAEIRDLLTELVERRKRLQGNGGIMTERQQREFADAGSKMTVLRQILNESLERAWPEDAWPHFIEARNRAITLMVKDGQTLEQIMGVLSTASLAGPYPNGIDLVACVGH